MSFYRDTMRTARKDHKCDLCGAIIQKGEKYHDKAGNDPDMWSSKECEKCQPVIDEYFDSNSSYRDEGYCADWLHDWWRDYKCPECKYEYPKCNPDADCECSDPEDCDVLDKYGRCQGGDSCDEMTHYCRCEKFEVDNDQEPTKDPQQEILQQR